MPAHAVTRWADLAARAHRRYRRVPTRLLLGLIEGESSGREGQVSSAGARGLTQFMPATARTYHVNTNPGHARSQIFGAAHYLSDLIAQTGSKNRALYRYSGGSSAYPGQVRGRARSYAGVARRANRRIGLGGAGPQRRTVGGRGRIPGVPGTPGVAPRQSPTPASTLAVDVLRQSLEQASTGPQGPPPTPLTPPSFSATSALKLAGAVGGQSLESAGAPAQEAPPIDELLRQIAAAPGAHVQHTATPGIPGIPGSSFAVGPGGRVQVRKMAPGRSHYPAARRGKIIGTPFSGTHTLGNWQSDRAIDIALPKGTPIVAVANGVISPHGLGFGRLTGGGGRFAGLRLHLAGKHNTFFYQHLSRYAHGIRPGVRVRRGQVIGFSGVANGVAHLHFAQEHGSPIHTIHRQSRRAPGGGGGRGPGGVPRGTRRLHGWAHFDGKRVAGWIKPWLVYARRHGWRGHVTSGGRTRVEQAYLYSHPQGYPVAPPGSSNHEGRNFPRGAVDVDHARQLARILSRARRRGAKVPLRYAGAKDAVHFSHPHGGGY